MLERYPEGFACKRIALLISVLAAMLCGCPAFALPQAGAQPPIRVESGDVVVPVSVYDSSTLQSVQGLTARDFRVFEDGKGQKLLYVAVGRRRSAVFLDNFGVEEWGFSLIPGQIWGLILRKPLPFRFSPSLETVYSLVYAQPDSSRGSCHEIKVKVNSGPAYVHARDEYCNTPHSASDPLAGTPLSTQMEGFAASVAESRFQVKMHAGFLYANQMPARIYVTAEFPGSGAKYELLSLVKSRSGPFVLRSSDTGGEYVAGDISLFRAESPNHHEIQMELPSGDYELQTVVSADGRLGKAQEDLSVPPFDGRQLGVSSVFICRQYHDFRQTKNLFEGDDHTTANDFVPLISKAREYTPTADTKFRQKDIFFAYFEVYEPLLVTTPITAVQTRLRIFNAETDQAVSDTGWQSTTEWIEPGSPVIHIAPELELKKMSRGSYRLEIQASDSSERITDTHTATFTIE